MDEAKSTTQGRGRGQLSRGKANSHEAEADAKIVLIFLAIFYILTPFSPKAEIFGRFSMGLQKCRLRTGFNTGTLLANFSITTSCTQATASVSTH